MVICCDMNKYNKGENCGYCGIFSNSCQKEHVFGKTVNPIIIPSCPKCNNVII